MFLLMTCAQIFTLMDRDLVDFDLYLNYTINAVLMQHFICFLKKIKLVFIDLSRCETQVN